MTRLLVPVLLLAVPAAADDGFRLISLPLPAVPVSRGEADPVAFSPDGSRVATACGPGAAVWEVATGKLLARLHLPEPEGPTLVGFTADGNSLLCVGRDAVVRWFDLGTGKQVRERPLPPAPRPLPAAYSPVVAVGPGADWLLVSEYANDGQVLRAVDAVTGATRGEIKAVGVGYQGQILTRDGRLAVGSGGTRTVQVWDVAGGKLLRTLADPTRGRAFGRRVLGGSADGKFLAVEDGPSLGKSNYRLGVWGLDDGRLCALLPSAGSGTTAAFAADGRSLAVGVQSGTFTLLDLLTGEARPDYTLPGRGGFRVASPDGKALAVLSTALGFEAAPATLHLTAFPTLPDPLPAGGDLDADHVTEWWGALGSANEFRRRYAVRAFAARPDQAVYLAGERTKADPPARRALVADLLKVLDDDSHETRDKAQAELLPLAHRFEPLLAAAAKAAGPGEVRNRLTTLTAAARDASPPADLLADLSAVELLEAVGTTESRALLAKLAGGATDSRLTLAARAAVGRLGTRPPDSGGSVKK